MKGILFKPGMIKAIVEGDKTQIRRVMKPQPFIRDGVMRWEPKTGVDINLTDHSDLAIPFARYKVGEIVYIKEAIHRFNLEYASYDLDFTPVMFLQSANRFHWRWQRNYLSPLHLPCEAARYFIRITDARAERLQDITEEDAIAEGIDQNEPWGFPDGYINSFAWLWDSINKPLYDWPSNPFVWRYEFELVKEGK